MAWSPISGVMSQYQKTSAAGGGLASGYFLKFYNTSNVAIQMASASDGSGLLGKAQLDSSGYPINGSGDRFIPFIDQDYRPALYTNVVDADANIITSADWFPGTTPRSLIATQANPITEATTASARANDDLGGLIDQFVRIAERIAGKPIDALYEILAGAGTDDDGAILNSNTLNLFHLKLLPQNSEVSIAIWGATASGADERSAIVNAMAYSSANGLNLIGTDGIHLMGKDGANFFSVLPPSNMTLIMPEGCIFKALTADSDYQIFRCGGTHGSRTNIHFRGGQGDMNVTVTPVDNGAEFIRFSNCINFSAHGIKVSNCNGAGIRADGYGAAGANNDWFKSATNYATDWGQSSVFSFRDNVVDNCYLGIELEGGAKNGDISDNEATNIVAHSYRLASADTVTVKDNRTDGCQTGVWIDRSYNCHILRNQTLNYTQHAIPVAFLEGGSITGSMDDGSGVLGTNHAINDSFQYVEADYTSVGLGAGSLRNVKVCETQSTNRIFIQHAKQALIKNNWAGLDVMRAQQDRCVLEDNFGSFIESGFDYYSVRNGERHKLLSLTSISGTFTAGETVTGGTSSAIGVVVSFSGSNLAIKVTVGTFVTAETVTGASSSATGTVDSISTANMLVKHQVNSDDTVSRFSLLQGPSPAAMVISVGNGSVGDQGLRDSFGCNRLEKTATGVYKMYFDRTFANANSIGLIVTPTLAINWRQGTTTTTTAIIETFDSAGTALDAGLLTVLVYGEVDT